MIVEAGVILEYSSPYSPTMIPIEYLFGSIKNIIRSNAQDYLDLIEADFKSYLEMQIGMMREDQESMKRMARGHFKMAGYWIEEC